MRAQTWRIHFEMKTQMKWKTPPQLNNCAYRALHVDMILRALVEHMIFVQPSRASPLVPRLIWSQVRRGHCSPKLWTHPLFAVISHPPPFPAVGTGPPPASSPLPTSLPPFRCPPPSFAPLPPTSASALLFRITEASRSVLSQCWSPASRGGRRGVKISRVMRSF